MIGLGLSSLKPVLNFDQNFRIFGHRKQGITVKTGRLNVNIK